MFVSRRNGREEQWWLHPLPCCPVNHQCLRKKTQIEEILNYCEHFAAQLHLRLELWSCNLLVFWQTKPSPATQHACIEIMMVPHLNIKKPRKFYIRRNNNKVSRIKTGCIVISDLIPWSNLENSIYATLF